MKRIFCLITAALSLLPPSFALANVKFKIEMQNYTDAELKFYCKTITSDQKWVFPGGGVTVPPKTSVTEEVEISRSAQGPHEEIQCNYAGKDIAVTASAMNAQGVPVKILEKTTDSVVIDASFGGLLQLVVTPAIARNMEVAQVLDTHAEFMVSFEDR